MRPVKRAPSGEGPKVADRRVDSNEPVDVLFEQAVRTVANRRPSSSPPPRDQPLDEDTGVTDVMLAPELEPLACAPLHLSPDEVTQRAIPMLDQQPTLPFAPPKQASSADEYDGDLPPSDGDVPENPETVPGLLSSPLDDPLPFSSPPNELARAQAPANSPSSIPPGPSELARAQAPANSPSSIPPGPSELARAQVPANSPSSVPPARTEAASNSPSSGPPGSSVWSQERVEESVDRSVLPSSLAPTPSVPPELGIAHAPRMKAMLWLVGAVMVIAGIIVALLLLLPK